MKTINDVDISAGVCVDPIYDGHPAGEEKWYVYVHGDDIDGSVTPVNIRL